MNKKLILKMATILFAAVSFSALNNSNVTTYAMEDSKLPSNDDIKNSANEIEKFKETLRIVKEKGNLKEYKIRNDMLKEFEGIKNEYYKTREKKLKQIEKNKQELKEIIEIIKQNDKIIDEIAKMDNEKIAKLVDEDGYKYGFYPRIKELKLNIDEIELLLRTVVRTAETNIEEVEKMFRDSEVSESKASELKNEKKPNKESEENIINIDSTEQTDEEVNIDSTEQTDEDENKIDWDFIKKDADIVDFFKKIKETKDNIEKHKNKLEKLKKANNLTDEQIKEISEKNKKESDPIYYEKVRQETQILNVRKEELKKLFELAKDKIHDMNREKFRKFESNTYKLKAQLNELKDKVYEYRKNDKEWEYAKKIMEMSDAELSKEQEQNKHKINEDYLKMRDLNNKIKTRKDIDFHDKMFRDAIINESSFRKAFKNRIRQNLYNYILLDFLPSNYFDVNMDKYTNLDEDNYKNLSTRVLYNEMIDLKQKLLRTDELVRDNVEHLMFDMNNEKSYKNFKEDIENINIEALSEMYVRLNEYVSGISGQGLDNYFRTNLFMFLDRIKKIVALKNRLLYLNKTIKTNLENEKKRLSSFFKNTNVENFDFINSDYNKLMKFIKRNIYSIDYDSREDVENILKNIKNLENDLYYTELK